MTGTSRIVSTIEGPLEGGSHGRPFAASIVDLAPYGYDESDYVVSGTAGSFLPAPGSTRGPHGRWAVTESEALPYRTRLLVRRPPVERFNGTVIVEFMQEYFANERDTNYRWNAEAILREGFAWVGASLHHEGIDGPSGEEMRFGDFTMHNGPTLAAWDPERYGTLTIPDSSLSYDILSQIGRCLGPNRTTAPVDPLEGLSVRRLLAVGNTIAAVRLQHYINAVHPMHHVFDGFFLQDLTDIGLPLGEGVQPAASSWLRTDVDAPVIVMNTMTAVVDAITQPDGTKLRFWEPVGSSHTTGPYMARVAAATKRDMDLDTPICPPDFANTLPQEYISSAAIVALHRWTSGGDAPPSQPRVEREGTTIRFDDVGNVSGGLRSPWVDVPIACYDWQGDCLGGAGRTHPLSVEQLTARYGTPERYRDQFAAATREAVTRGVLLPEDAQQALDDAEKVAW
jgi:hypothetical protein